MNKNRYHLVRLLIVWVLLGSLLPAPRAYACSCARPTEVASAVQQATAVFTGKVSGVAGLFRLPREQSFNSGIQLVFDVMEVWKGTPYEQLVIHTGNGGGDCGYGPLPLGTEMLVYAYGQPDHLTTNICTRTTRLADARTDLAILGQGDPPTVAGANEMPPPQFLWQLGLGGAAVLVGLGAILFMIRRRRPTTQ